MFEDESDAEKELDLDDVEFFFEDKYVDGWEDEEEDFQMQGNPLHEDTGLEEQERPPGPGRVRSPRGPDPGLPEE